MVGKLVGYPMELVYNFIAFLSRQIYKYIGDISWMLMAYNVV